MCIVRLSSWRGFIQWLLSGVLWLGVWAMPSHATELLPAGSVPQNLLGSIPTELQYWIDWVLYEHPERRCPVNYNATEQRQCVWPTTLKLTLSAEGGQFEQNVYTDRESWLILPGDRQHWPREVRLNDELIPVLEQDQRPALKAASGSHRLSGRFAWRGLPESIRIPAQNALLDLTIDGQAVPVTRVEDEGLLWLRQRPSEPAEQDSLDLQVFRLLTDGIPLVMETRLELRVSGQAREETLGPALLADFLPLALNSPLPARLEPDGRLRVQLRPGNWSIQLTARHRGPVDTLTRPATAEPWPHQEIWTFQAQNQLRVAQVEGVTALDPAQTRLPMEWRRWPAYLVQADDTARFITRSRGDTEKSPENLTLERILWLDFSGSDYTVQDRLSGTLNATRLEATPALRLGRAEINGEDQFITQQPGAAAPGVEVRRLQDLKLVADSRLEPPRITDLPAVGWQIAPQNISVILNLPPGWRLLGAAGPDSIGNAWLYSWNLLDLFIVLVIAFGFARLWHWSWGVVALLGLMLCYHEPNVPRFVWLNVLAAIALWRVLPAGRLRPWINAYRWLALLALLGIAAIFVTEQVRGTLHPQLEREQVMVDLSMPASALRPAPSEAFSEIPASQSAPLSKGATLEKSRKKLQQNYTPDIKVQTGPGLPVWHWRQATLRWHGPVAAEERLQLWLLPPWGTRSLLLTGVALLLAMVWRVLLPRRSESTPPTAAAEERKSPPLGNPSSPLTGRRKSKRSVVAVLMSVLLLVPLWGGSPPAHAELPSPELLNALRERLTEPPDCQRCGDLAALALTLNGNQLELKLSFHAQVDTAVPLPMPREGLIVRAVELDNLPVGLFRHADQLLWMRLPAGLHDVLITAIVPEAVATLQLPLPMTPGQTDLSVTGWLVEGYVEGRADQQLQLTRQRQTAGTPLQAGVMPPFVQVEREIILDTDWRVETRVRRLSQADSAAVLEIPLLPGERITTPEIRVRDDRVLLNLPPDRAEVIWEATLNRNDTLLLKAAERDDWVEIWRLRAGPLWHVASSGIPLIQRVDQEGQWLPEWRPWPGEQLTLTISRPEGIPGNTATIDSSNLRLRPGQRLSEASLDMLIRASRGAEQTVTLPPGAVLTSLRINELQQPIQQQGQQVVLPLTPGVQRIALNWRSEHSLTTHYTTPVVDLGGPSVNASLSIELPRNRWVLLTGGPVIGPAVLFWGLLLVILLGAVALGRLRITPLRTLDWFLLGVGLSQTHIVAMMVVVGWLLLLGWRKTWVDSTVGAFKFNVLQLTLVGLTLLAGIALLSAIEQGLLGAPDMQIAGHHSSAWQLNWYQDRADGSLPTAWVISGPLLVYRGLMLVWALWLALAVLRWLGWGWDCFSAAGLWRQRSRRTAEKTADQPTAEG